MPPSCYSSALPPRFACAITLFLLAGAAAGLVPATDLQAKTNTSSPAIGGLVWEDTFGNASPGRIEPNSKTWTYEQGGGGWGNGELETYCAYGSSKAPCNPSQPNAFIGPDGYLHITGRKTATGQLTSARMISKHLQSFQYGRIEARIKIPAGPGVWPAFWMLGENIDQINWPACGELDIMENVGPQPGTVHGSIHGSGFTGTKLGLPYELPGHEAFAAHFHNYGMSWSPQRIEYYVDDPAKPYAVFTPADLPPGAKWPFDDGSYFLLLNLALGGAWPGPPDASTKFPAEMLVEYVRVWRLGGSPPAPSADKTAGSK